MSDNRYTLFVITGKGKRMRQLHLTKAFLRVFLAVFMILAAGTVFLSLDYFRVRGQYGELSQLRELARSQKEQIDDLAAKVSEFEERMISLKEFDRKIRAITNMEGDRKAGQLPGMGGSVPEEDLSDPEGKAGADALYETIQKNMDQLLEEVSFQEDSFREIFNLLQSKKNLLASTPSIWPCQGWVTSEFGYRTSPFTGKRELHRGMDISTKLGDDVTAPADGVVVKVAREPDMGNMIKIDHGRGICTYYGHLVKYMVRQGEKVKRGTVIGLVGNSGRSTGPHLHYSVTLSGVYVNPRKYLF